VFSGQLTVPEVTVKVSNAVSVAPSKSAEAFI